MERTVHNPWSWQDRFGFVQANEIRSVERWLICSGQVSVDDDGNVAHANDMAGQINQAVDNIETVLSSAEMTLADVQRLAIYVTDVDAFYAHAGVLASRLDSAGCIRASTLIGVDRLAFPELMIELEATAAA